MQLEIMWPLNRLFANQCDEQIKPDRIISMNEVSFHDAADDCWVVLFNNVYNITTFFNLHPGGSEVLMEHGGRDATIAFQNAGHTDVSLSIMENYRIGRLPEHEHLNLDYILGSNWKSSIAT